LFVVPQEGRLLLSTGHGEAQLIGFRAEGAWSGRSRDGTQALADLLIAQRSGIDGMDADGLLIRRQQLHGPGAVAANRSQQIEGTGTRGLKPGLGSATDRFAIREEVVKPALQALPVSTVAPRAAGRDSDNGRNRLEFSQVSS
jgi:hypothetical protein